MTIASRLRERVPLAPLTTFEVGGEARLLFEATQEGDVEAAVAFARAHGLPLLVLGGGSNLVVSDRGFDGLVLRLATRGVERLASSAGLVRLRVLAGEPLDALVSRSVELRAAGVECLSGVPGSVGATPVQNVGAYGQEVSETIERVELLDRTSMVQTSFEARACGFGYRSSVFKGALRERYVVLAVTFVLRADGAPSVKYAELARHLAARGLVAPSLADVRAAVLSLRRAKSMVLDPHDENRRSNRSRPRSGRRMERFDRGAGRRRGASRRLAGVDARLRR